MADFQADAALRVSRKVSRQPQEFAQEVLDAARLDDICQEAVVSGPGFINLKIADRVLEEAVTRMAAEERFGIATRPPSVVVIDYSAPNIAKEMHVGHLRSTIIGDAAARLLKWLGHDVRRQNHLGDWGTPFGMLIEHLLETRGEDDESLAVGDLDGFYRAARKRFDEDPDFRDRARNRVVLLQSGDPESIQSWERLVGVSQRYFKDIYDCLDVTLRDEDFVGESSYQNELDPTIEELRERGLLEESEGAVCAFIDGYTGRDGNPLPLIVRKSDGGYGYAATDLAAIRRRARDIRASRILYVVGLPQSQHLGMVFEVARRAGWLQATAPEHVGFGSVLGSDGKMLRSRAGAVIKLSDLLSEAVARAGEMIVDKNPDLNEDARSRVARQLGIGAVKYADLSTDRTKDYVFDLTRMLALDGDTAPYLQYAHARIRSIFRKHEGDEPSGGCVTFEKAVERELALNLLQFEDVVEDVARSLEFHWLTGYLYGLATTFSAFYQQCPVLRAPDAIRRSRLTLCDLTARVLQRGLSFLGIAAPDRL